ncbi:MAG: DUF3078 domain-containing protein [Bacteroidota bacterium]
MKKQVYLIVVTLLFFSSFLFAQEKIITQLPDSTTYWKRKNKVGFDVSETAFMNWSAGGNNSISGLLKGNFIRKYEHRHLKWHNELIVRYGISKQDGVSARKTEDILQLNSTFGYRKDTISNWFYSSKFNFNTQFTNGFAYPNTDRAISKFFAPAYVFLGVGTEYFNKNENLNLYFSPLTQKTTLVLDERLANEGAFGVTKALYDSNGKIIEKGEKSRTELGILVTGKHKSEIYNNVFMENRVVFYTDYLNNFGNIDVNWQMQFDLIVNKYVSANIGTHIIYDDDIKAKKEVDGEQVTLGPRLQLKQLLGIGLAYEF